MTKAFALTLVLTISCTHTSSPTHDSSQAAIAQDMGNTEGCDPNSDIEINPKKQKSFQLVRLQCKQEITKLCQDIECKDLMKPTQVCLMMSDEQLSTDCKNALNRHIKEFQPYVKTLDE